MHMHMHISISFDYVTAVGIKHKWLSQDQKK